MKIRCTIDQLALHGMPLSPSERTQLETVLHEQLGEALRAGWHGADGSQRPAFGQQLRIELPARAAATPLGQTIGQSLGTALSPPGSDAGTPVPASRSR